MWHPVACATLHFCLRAPNQIWVLFSYIQNDWKVRTKWTTVCYPIWMFTCTYAHKYIEILHALGKCTNYNQGWWWRHAHIEPFSWSSIQNIQPDILMHRLMHRIEMCIAIQYFNWITTKTIEFYLFGLSTKKKTKQKNVFTFYRLFTQILVAIICCCCYWKRRVEQKSLSMQNSRFIIHFRLICTRTS